MANKKAAGGVAHSMPNDLNEALTSNDRILEAWESLTTLARNEWICWTISSKKPGTRQNHITRIKTELLEGKRRPCCWAGCIHRKKL